METNDGGIIVSGYYSYPMDIDGSIQTPTRVVAQKLTADGESIWTQDYGGTNGDYGWHVRQGADGGYLLFAYAYSEDGDVSDFNGTIDAWLLGLDASGELLWEKTYGGSMEESAADIAITEAGDCVLLITASGWNSEMSQYLGGIDAWVVGVGTREVGVPHAMPTHSPLDIMSLDGRLIARIEPTSGPARCTVVDAVGRIVIDLSLAPGTHEVHLGGETAPGIYTATLTSGQLRRTARFVEH